MKHFVEAHSGTVSVTSKYGVGSKFGMLLHLELTEEPEPNSSKSSEPTSSSSSGGHTTTDFEEVRPAMPARAGALVVHGVGNVAAPPLQRLFTIAVGGQG